MSDAAGEEEREDRLRRRIEGPLKSVVDIAGAIKTIDEELGALQGQMMKLMRERRQLYEKLDGFVKPSQF